MIAPERHVEIPAARGSILLATLGRIVFTAARDEPNGFRRAGPAAQAQSRDTTHATSRTSAKPTKDPSPWLPSMIPPSR